MAIPETAPKTTLPVTAPAEEHQSQAGVDSSASGDREIHDVTPAGPLFIAACLVLPILWGVIVHQVFRRLRRRTDPTNSREVHWSDYQI